MDAPEHILEWLKVNEPDMRRPVVDMLRCPLCGDWFTSIDHLAPYHWETCWCAKCQKHPHEPESVIPRSNAKSSDPAQ